VDIVHEPADLPSSHPIAQVKKLSQTSPGGVVLVPELVLLGQAAP
jgi:hypothetical protein